MLGAFTKTSPAQCSLGFVHQELPTYSHLKGTVESKECVPQAAYSFRDGFLILFHTFRNSLVKDYRCAGQVLMAIHFE